MKCHNYCEDECVCVKINEWICPCYRSRSQHRGTRLITNHESIFHRYVHADERPPQLWNTHTPNASYIPWSHAQKNQPPVKPNHSTDPWRRIQRAETMFICLINETCSFCFSCFVFWIISCIRGCSIISIAWGSDWNKAAETQRYGWDKTATGSQAHVWFQASKYRLRGVKAFESVSGDKALLYRDQLVQQQSHREHAY